MSSDGHLALTASEHGKVILWDLQQGNVLRTLSERGVKDIILSQENHWAFTGGDGGLSFWDLKRGIRLERFEEARITVISLSPDEEFLVALVKNNHLLVWPKRSF